MLDRIDNDTIKEALTELSRFGRSGYSRHGYNDAIKSEPNVQLPVTNKDSLKPRVYQV